MTEPAYRVRQGGLMRCCLETLQVIYTDDPQFMPFDDSRADCRYCSTVMVFRLGAWEKYDSRPPVPPAAEPA